MPQTHSYPVKQIYFSDLCTLLGKISGSTHDNLATFLVDPGDHLEITPIPSPIPKNPPSYIYVAQVTKF